jgi:hypothetical protein
MTELKPEGSYYLSVQGDGGRMLLAVHTDGTVEAPSLEAASEAGRVFVASIRQHLVPRTDGDDGELVERLLVMAPESGKSLVCQDRTSAEMNADIRQAADRITALSAEVERLRGYASHSEECAINGWLPRGDWGPPCPPCSCGLAQALGAKP